MKANQFIGTIMCVIGLVCASGESLTNGILAIVFMGFGVLCIKGGSTISEARTEGRKASKRKAAA